MPTAAAVWVDVIPSLKGFGSTLGKEVSKAADTAGRDAGRATSSSYESSVAGTGTRAGKQVTRELGSSVSANARGAMTGLNTAFDNTFSWAEGLASGAGGRISTTFGRAMTGALGPIGQFRDGFANATAAASQFSGVAGTVGGAVRRAFDGGAAAVEAFRSGFSGASSAATGFAGLASRAGSVVGSAWDTARAPISGFRLGFNDASGAAGSFSATSRGVAGVVGNAFQAAGGVLGRFRDGFTNSGAAASAFGGAASTAGGMARRAFDGVRGAVSAMGENVRTASEQAGAALNTGMLAPLTTMARFTGIATIGTAIVGIGVAGARTAVDIQKSQAALTGLYGSGQMANDMLTRLRGLAASSPIEYTAFARGAESLAYMGYSGDTAYTVLQRVNTALVASGKGAESMDQVNYAMLEMVNTGKVYAEQLTQMSQAGLPVWSMLADYMHTTIADVRDQVTQGKLSIDTVMQAIQAGGGETFQRMEAAAEQSSRTLSAVWARTKDNVALAFADMIQPMMGGASGALAAAGDAITNAFRALPGIFSAVGGFLAPLWQGFSGVASVIGGVLLSALRTVVNIYSAVYGPVLRAITGFLSEHKIILYALGGVLGFIGTMLAVTTARMLIFNGAALAAKVATMAWQAAQWLLNAAMLNNPLGYVMMAVVALAAAVVYAYNHFDGFRAIVQGAWAGISTAATWAWSVLSPILSGIGVAASAVGSAFVWLWQAVIVPAWTAITTAIGWAWGVMSPILGFLGTALSYLGVIVFVALALPFQLAWNLIVAAVQTGWALIQGVWNVMAAVAGWLYTVVLAPLFAGIGAAWNALMIGMSAVWNGVLLPVFNTIAAVATWLGNVALAGVFAAIGWAWNALVAGMRLAWDTVLHPAWDAIAAAASWLWNTALAPVFGLIGAGWNALLTGIDWMWQNILRPCFDAISAAVAGVGQAFANVVDWIRTVWGQIGEIAKAPVNFVIDVVYNRGIVALWNGIAGVFGLGTLAPMAMLASGGTVPAGPMATNQPTAIVGEGNPAHPEYVIPTDPKYRGRAASLWAAAGSDMGMPMMASGGILGSAWGAVKSVAGSVLGGITDAFGWITSIAGDVAGGVKALFGSVFGDSDRTPGTGSLTDALKHLPGKVVDAIVGKVTDWLASSAAAAGPIGGGAAPPGMVNDWIQQALATLGWPSNYAAGLYQQIMTESGGNPGAVQHGYTDINTLTGNLARGIMQVIPPTFASNALPGHGNIMNPVDNIIAGARYAMARYGPSWFNPGSQHSHGYDDGGWLMPGETLAVNRTGRPEPVLTAEQWDTVRRIAEGGGRTITVNAKTDATPDHIAHTVDRHLAMAARR